MKRRRIDYQTLVSVGGVLGLLASALLISWAWDASRVAVSICFMVGILLLAWWASESD